MSVLSYKQALAEYKSLTNDPDLPIFKGMGKNEFADTAGGLLGNDKRYNTLRGNFLNRAAFGLGALVDGLGDNLTPFGNMGMLIPADQNFLSPNKALGTAFRTAGRIINPNSPELHDAMEGVGNEMFGQLLGLGAFALPGGIAIGPAILYSDAYNDALEEGRSPGEATGSGVISAVTGAALGPASRLLGGVGKSAAKKLNDTFIKSQLGRSGLVDYAIKGGGTEFGRLTQRAKEVQSRIRKLKKSIRKLKGDERTAAKDELARLQRMKLGIGPSGKGVQLKSLTKTQQKLIRSAIKEPGLTGLGVTADIVDTWWFNENLGVGQLLTDPNYLIPMLAGDSFGLITGAALQKRGWKFQESRQKRNEARTQNLEEAFEKVKQIRRDDATLKTELTEEQAAKVIGKDELNIEKMEQDDRSTKFNVKEGGQDVFSYTVDRNNRLIVHDVTGDPQIAMLAIRNHFRDQPFEYVARIDGSDANFINNVIGKLGDVESGIPGVLRVKGLGDLADTDRQRAAFHLENPEEMPLVQGWHQYVERFIRAARYGDVDADRLKLEARRIFRFYHKRHGLSTEASMKRALKVVEGKNYKTFYDIYYGDAANQGDRDLARVLNQNVRRPTQRGGLETREQLGVVFWHDEKTRTTLEMVPEDVPDTNAIGFEGEVATAQTRIVQYNSGVRVRDYGRNALTLDQQSALELATGQVADMTRGAAFKSTRSVRGDIKRAAKDLFEGLGFSEDTRVVVADSRDLRDPKALRELGAPFLVNYANVRPENRGWQWMVKSGDKRVHLIVLNENKPLTRGRAGLQHALLHEFGHLIHREMESRPEFAGYIEELQKEHANLELLSADDKTVQGLKDFMSIGRFWAIAHKQPKGKGKLKSRELTDDDHVKYLKNFEEWFAEQFVKYARGQMDQEAVAIGKRKHPRKFERATNKVVDRYFTELVQFWRRAVKALKKTFGVSVPDESEAFTRMMREASRGFFTRIISQRHKGLLEGFQEAHRLSDTNVEFLSKHLWQSDYSPEFLVYLGERIDAWSKRVNSQAGNGGFERVVYNAQKDYNKRATKVQEILNDPKRFAKVDERLKVLNEIFLGIERLLGGEEVSLAGTREEFHREGLVLGEFPTATRRAGRGKLVSGEFADKWMDILRTIDKALSLKSEFGRESVDAVRVVDATARAQSILVRWLHGELKGQTKPQDGGTFKLEMAIRKNIENARSKPVEKVSMNSDGRFEKAEKGQLLRFSDKGEADLMVKRLTEEVGNEGYNFQAERIGKTQEWKIVRVHDEFSSRQEFNEEYVRPTDDTVDKSATDLEAFENTMDNLGHGPSDMRDFHRDTLNPEGQGPSSMAADFPRRVRRSVRQGIVQRLMPEKLLRQLDAAVKELEDTGADKELQSMAKDLGVDSVGSYDDLVDLVVGQAMENPKKVADIVSLWPEHNKNAMRGVIDFVHDMADAVESQVRFAETNLEDTLDQREQIDNIRANLLRANREIGDIETIPTVTNRIAPGGIKETEMVGEKIFKGPFRGLQKLYDNWFTGAVHLGASNPQVADATAAARMEKVMGNKALHEIMDEFHARRPPNAVRPGQEVDYTVDHKNRSFLRVFQKGGRRLGKVYDDIIRLQNMSGANAAMLRNKVGLTTDKQRKAAADLDNMLGSLTPDEIGAVFDMLERSKNANLVRIGYEDMVSHEVNRLSAASLLLKKAGYAISSKEAIGIMEDIYGMVQQQKFGKEALDWEVAQRAGIDLGDAEGVVQFFFGLTELTTNETNFKLSRPWDVTERRMKQFYVPYISRGDKVTSGLSFDTLAEAHAWADKVTKAGGKVIGSPETWNTKLQKTLYGQAGDDLFKALSEEVDKKQAIVRAAFEGVDDELGREVSQLLSDLETSVVTSREAESPLALLRGKRKFKGGREELNMFEQQVEHARRTTGALMRRRTDAIVSFTRQDKVNQSDHGQKLMALVDQAVENQRTPDTAAGQFLTKFGFTMFIGMNTSTALIEAAQWPVTMSPILREMGAGFAESISIPAKLSKQALASTLLQGQRRRNLVGVGWKDDMHKKAILRAEQEGILNIRRNLDVNDDIVQDRALAYKVARGEDLDQRRSSLKTWNPYEMAYRLGAKMYSHFNRFNAEISLISALEVLRKKNPTWDFDQLYTEAARWADIANGSAGRTNRPIGLMSGRFGMRTLGQASISLLSYTNAQIANYMRFVKKSFDNGTMFTGEERTAAKWALAQGMTTQLLGMGVMGLPLAAGINTLFANLFGWDLEDVIRDTFTTVDEDNEIDDFWANWANYGLLNAAGFDADVQTRMALGSMAGINPYSGWDALQLAGPAVSYVQSSLVALKAAPEQGIMRTAIQLMPAGVRRALMLTLTDEGEVRDRRDQYLLTPTAGEKAAIFLGFNPTRVRRSQVHQTEIDRATRQEGKVKRRLSHEAFDYARKGNFIAAQTVLREAAEQLEGTSYNDLTRSVEDKFLTEKFGRGYKSGAALSQQISSRPGVPKPSNMEVYRTRLDFRQAMGQISRPSIAQIRINRRADEIMQTSPFLSPALAKSLARAERQTNVDLQKFTPEGLAGLASGL